MKRLFVLLIIPCVVVFAGNAFSQSQYEKDDALWQEVKILAKAGKIDEALAKTGEMSPARKETSLGAVAIIAADNFADYDKAIEIGKTLAQTERREYLWLYIPRSAAVKLNYDGFMIVAEKTIRIVFEEYAKSYLDPYNIDESVKSINETVKIYQLSLYRDAAVIYANRDLLQENIKVIKIIGSIDRDTTYYQSAVTATIIEIMNGLHSQPEAVDGYLAALNYRKVHYSKNIVYGGAERTIVAYDTPNTDQYPDILLLYDENGEKKFLTAIFYSDKIKDYLIQK